MAGPRGPRARVFVVGLGASECASIRATRSSRRWISSTTVVAQSAGVRFVGDSFRSHLLSRCPLHSASELYPKPATETGTDFLWCNNGFGSFQRFARIQRGFRCTVPIDFIEQRQWEQLGWKGLYATRLVIVWSRRISLKLREQQGPRAQQSGPST